MENIDYEKIRKNSSFVSRHFFDKRVDFPLDYGNIHLEEVEALKKSIEIIKSGEYSKPYLKQNRLFDHAPAFWKDLYWLEYYENGKNTTKASFEKQQTDFNNNPDKDDILLKYRFDQVKIFKQKNLEDIDNIIKLTKVFRELINREFPELEKEFARLLQEHNDFKVSEAEKDKARDEEREKRRAELRKRIEEQSNIETLQPPRKNRKPEQIKFDGFFDLNKIDESKISEIKECFKDDTGKNFASLVELLKNQYQLIEIIPSSKTKGLKNFYRAIGGNEERYEAVRKCFNEKNEFKYDKKDDTLLSINKRLKKIIE
jgi:hypothetical protein